MPFCLNLATSINQELSKQLTCPKEIVSIPDHEVEGVICHLGDLLAITASQVDVVAISSMRKQQWILEGIIKSMEL